MVADRFQMSDGLYMTKEQYFALDEATDGQYEFYNGYVIMLTPPSSAYDDGVFIDMSGGSIAHSAICARLAFLIGQGLPDDGPCLVHSSDVKVEASAQRNYFHPDVSVACSEETGQLLRNPVVVIEVLSPATEKRDRSWKFQSYKELPSVQGYVLVSSTYKAIEVYRHENDWRPYHYRSGDLVELTSIGVSFPFDAVYRRIPM
jgi:Uma2 family endonuclease